MSRLATASIALIDLESRIRDAELALLRAYGLAPAERFVVVRTDPTPVRLRVLELGLGPPVVFLHAASWFAAHWAPMLEHMRGWRSVCVDMPGHGLSDGVDYRGADLRRLQVELFARLFAELGISRTPVVGNSLGGMTALYLALDRPELVSRVAVLGVPATALPGAKPDLLLSMLSVRGLNRALLRLPSSSWSSRLALGRSIGRVRTTPLPEPLYEMHSLARRRPAFARTLGTWLPETHRWLRGRPEVVLSDDALATLAQPVLFFWGERDAFGGPDIARRAARVMPRAVVETHPGGHHPQLTCPQACARSVAAFLASGDG